MNKPTSQHPFAVERYQRQRWHDRHKMPVLTKLLVAGTIAAVSYFVAWTVCTHDTAPKLEARK